MPRLSQYLVPQITATGVEIRQQLWKWTKISSTLSSNSIQHLEEANLRSLEALPNVSRDFASQPTVTALLREAKQILVFVRRFSLVVTCHPSCSDLTRIVVSPFQFILATLWLRSETSQRPMPEPLVAAADCSVAFEGVAQV